MNSEISSGSYMHFTKFFVEGCNELWYLEHLHDNGYITKKVPKTCNTNGIAHMKVSLKDYLSNNSSARVFLIFDMDCKKGQQLYEKYKTNKRIIMCESKPSFEFWLSIHLTDDIMTDRTKIENYLKQTVGWEKGEENFKKCLLQIVGSNFEEVKEKVDNAIETANSLNQKSSYSNVPKAINGLK